MVAPRRPTSDPDHDTGRRDLVISGHEVSAALTPLRRDDPARRHGATHMITVTPPANVGTGATIAVDGVSWVVVTTRLHSMLRNYREILVRSAQA